MRKIIDLADANFKTPVVNGARSVSEGKIYVETSTNSPYCTIHGACLSVAPNNKLWRCPACNEGCWIDG